MAGIYLHIPFCKQACHYCDFHFSTNLKTRGEIMETMRREMELRKDFLPAEPISTIYFGGGTPSLLTHSEIEALLQGVQQLGHVNADAEITLEANPDDLSPKKLSELKAAGINRLSIGIQSFHQAHLQWMNRAHNAQQAEECLYNARNAGFDNFNVDLIYGFPELTEAQWKENIVQVLKHRPAHISCYSLTVEPGTALERFIQKGRQLAPDDEQSVRHFEILVEQLCAAGYDHYEVSNFALPGQHSKHNSAYWSGVSYLGIGPSAHSFNGQMRCWNVRNNHQYARSIRSDSYAPECEKIDRLTAYNEYLLTGLRTAKGIDIQTIKDCYQVDFNRIFKALIAQCLCDKKIESDGRRIWLTRKGLLWADAIAAQFFIVKE